MYAPFSGKQYTSTVFTCPLYFMRLRHLTRDKINSRAAGRKEQRTHQPTGGRGNEGGLRIGEMERDVLIGHGISDFMQERMMKCSDEATFYVCNSCGQMPIYNEAEEIFVCPSCDGPVRFVGDTADTIQMVKPITRSRTTFTRVKMPYTFKLLNQELGTFMNMGMRFVNSGSAARLKDESLDWLATGGEAANQLIDLPPFVPPEQPSSSATGAGGIPVEEIKVQVEKEPGVEVQPAVNASLLEQERKRAEEAEAALAVAQEAGPPPETVQITLPGAPQGAGEIGNVVVGPPANVNAAGPAVSGLGPPSQRGGSISLPNLTHPIVGRGSSTNVITLVLPSQGKGAGRPATGNNSAYVPKKKGVAFARLVDEQEREERGEKPESAKAADKGPTTIRVTKEDTDSDIKE
jgi:hypothetical protein